MKFSKRAFIGAMTAMAYSLCPLVADTDAASNLTDEQELEALREYVESKRDISITPKGGHLRIGGDVRVEYKHVHQVLDGKNVHGKFTPNGGGAGRMQSEPNIPANFADIEASLGFNYTNDKSFATLLFKFSNRAGLDTTNFSDATTPFKDTGELANSRLSYKGAYQPSGNKLNLARAFIGYELWDKDGHQVVATLGRQRLYDMLDSRVMFFSRFDGLAVKYTGAFEGIGQAQLTWGGFMVADRVSHYAHVVEAGLNRVAGSGLGVKYAFIDWARKGTLSDGSSASVASDTGVNTSQNPLYMYLDRLTNYSVSQASVSYDVPSQLAAGKRLKLYGAYVYNHKAKEMKAAEETSKGHRPKHNEAWYAGFTLGRIRAPGDYVFDFCYQYVEPQSVPEIDSFGGAGRGNLTGMWGVIDPTQGYTNYKGARAQLTYALTPDMLLNLKGHATRAAASKLSNKRATLPGVPAMLISDRLGERTTAKNSWRYLELELIYSF